jgi:hypothetical protein
MVIRIEDGHEDCQEDCLEDCQEDGQKDGQKDALRAEIGTNSFFRYFVTISNDR